MTIRNYIKNLENKLETNSSSNSQKHSNHARYHKLYAELTIINKYGLHARPAVEFIKIASKYNAEVIVENEEGKRTSGKSILGLLNLELSQGRKMRLHVRGNGDAYECFEKLKTLVSSGFEED